MFLGGKEDGNADYIDAHEMVEWYRSAIEHRDAAKSEILRREFDQIAQHLRILWAEYNGADDLAELATGDDEAK